MKFEHTATFMLSKISIAHRNLLERAMKEVGLHSGQTFTLLELWREDGQRQTDLAENMQVSAPTINKILVGLLEIGLVTRSRIDGDLRSTRIFLTDEGKAIRASVETQWIELETHVLARLTETESLILRQLLQKLLGQTEDE